MSADIHFWRFMGALADDLGADTAEFINRYPFDEGLRNRIREAVMSHFELDGPRDDREDQESEILFKHQNPDAV